MNQIIFNYKQIENNCSVLYKHKKNIYFIIFVITIIITFIISIYIIYTKIKIYRENQISKIFLNNYNIDTIYSDQNSENLSNNFELKLSDNISIIGLIEIPKINLSYPILSDVNEDLLKISVCRFSRTFAK